MLEAFFKRMLEQRAGYNLWVRALLLLFLFCFTLVMTSGAEATAANQSSTCTNQSSDQYVKYNGTEPIQQYRFTYFPVSILNTSYLIYATASNISISTAVMNNMQFQNFNATENISANSIHDQNGTFNLNGLLLTKGAYFLVLFAYQAPASVNYQYQIDSELTLENSTTFVGETMSIPAGYRFSIPVHLETLGSPSNIYLFGVSNRSVSYELFDKTTQSTVFSSALPETTTNLTLSSAGRVGLGYDANLSQGLYTISISNPGTGGAYVYFEYQLRPDYVNPYIVTYFRELPPAPTGIAAYGIFNKSGAISTYKADGSSVVGYANISSMIASNPKNPEDTSANLQLNAVLRVINADNSTDVYWPQNVMWFLATNSSAEKLVLYRNNVLNVSGDGAGLTNSTIVGRGFVSLEPKSGASYYGNYNSTYLYRYQFPLSFALYLNESVQPNTGVWVYTGIRLLQNGTLTNNNSIEWFDKILIVDPKVTSASFVVRGDTYLPIGANSSLGMFYDSELVFGGNAGGHSANFSQFDAFLSLYYYNQTLFTYPAVYPLGSDTAESADNLQSAYNGTLVTVSINPSPSYGLLTNDFTTSTYLEPAITSPAPNAITTSSIPPTSSNSISTSQTYSTTTSVNSNTTISSLLLPVFALIVLLVVIVLAMLVRRRK